MIFWSSVESLYLLLPLAGLIIGALATMTGSGGGFLFPLALILLFKIPPQIAVATSLVATLPVCITGTIGHYRRGNINFRLALIFGSAAIAGVIAGVFITQSLSEEQLKIGFGFYTIILSAVIFFNGYPKKDKTSGHEPLRSNLKRPGGGSINGFAGGLLSGTFGSSGTMPVLAGLFAMRLPLQTIAGTSMFVALINTSIAVGSHALIGKIDLTLVSLLTAGSLIGAISGPLLLAGLNLKKSNSAIKNTFAFVIFAIGMVLILN